MIITSVDFLPCEMPLEDASWRNARGAIPVNRGYVVCLTAEDGTVGYGYAQAFADKGTTFESLLPLLQGFAPLVKDRDPFQMESVLRALDRALNGSAPVKAGFDCALFDLMAKIQGLPLNALLGGAVRPSVSMMRILALKSPQETAEQARALVAEGYRHLKVKVDGDADQDVARVRAVREAVGPGIGMIVDANQAYTPKTAIRVINRMADAGIDIVEQPVPAGDLAGLALVTRSVPVMVEADESAASLGDVFRLVADRMVDSINLKIPPMGGLRNTLAAARICEAGHVQCRMGASFASQILQAQALHLASALPDLGYACELSEFVHFRHDPFAGLAIENGMMVVPQRPGSGVALQG